MKGRLAATGRLQQWGRAQQHRQHGRRQHAPHAVRRAAGAGCGRGGGRGGRGGGAGEGGAPAGGLVLPRMLRALVLQKPVGSYLPIAGERAGHGAQQVGGAKSAR